MNPNYFLHSFVWFVLFALVYVDDALAYIEPGTGSMIIQSLIAVIAGGLFALKTYWYKLKIFFSRKKDIPSKPEKSHVTKHK
jgi:hypothetical protein